MPLFWGGSRSNMQPLGVHLFMHTDGGRIVRTSILKVSQSCRPRQQNKQFLKRWFLESLWQFQEWPFLRFWHTCTVLYVHVCYTYLYIFAFYFELFIFNFFGGVLLLASAWNGSVLGTGACVANHRDNRWRRLFLLSQDSQAYQYYASVSFVGGHVSNRVLWCRNSICNAIEHGTWCTSVLITIRLRYAIEWRIARGGRCGAELKVDARCLPSIFFCVCLLLCW